MKYTKEGGPSMEELNQKIDLLVEKVDKLDEKVNQMQSEMQQMQNEMKQMQNEMFQMQKNIDQLFQAQNQMLQVQNVMLKDIYELKIGQQEIRKDINRLDKKIDESLYEISGMFQDVYTYIDKKLCF